MTTARLASLTGSTSLTAPTARLLALNGTTAVATSARSRLAAFTGSTTIAPPANALGIANGISTAYYGSAAVSRIYAGTRLLYGTAAPPAQLAWDWSDTNQPWATNGDPAVLTSSWPSSLTIVDLVEGGSGDFHTDLVATVAAQGGAKVIVRLQPKTYHIRAFRAPNSSVPSYALGFYAPDCLGLLGAGDNTTIIQLDPSIYTASQLSYVSQMTTASGPIQYYFGRVGDGSSPIYISGITFRGCDQQVISSYDSSLNISSQVAPYQGLALYQTTGGLVSYCRFQAASHAAYSQPPFETGNVTTQYGSMTYRHCDFDGRVASEIDSSQPRRSGPFMANNETLAVHEDCWFHHSNVSRYAVNDQNRNTSGTYSLTRCKFEEISNINNYGNGGVTNASCCGWESCNGTITVTDCIFVQNNPSTSGQIACHLQFTSVGSRNPQGGRLQVIRGTFRNAGFSSMDNYLSMRVIPTTYWAQDGYATTMQIYGEDGTQLIPLVYSGAYATSAFLSSNNASPATHYLIRTS